MHISSRVQVCSCQRTHTCSRAHTHAHTRCAHFSTAALAGVPPPGLGINNPLWGFYTFTFLFLTHFKVLFRVRSEDEGLGGPRMEKQAIWKIPVIFELFPKTPTGATVRPTDVQPQAGPTAIAQASCLTQTPSPSPARPVHHHASVASLH